MNIRKLIGARVFLKNYEAQVEKVEAKHRSARDFFGHGSHTLSTAGGNFVRGAQVEGNGNGTAKGGSPRARLVAYKACWDDLNGGGCQDADIVQAFDHAIQDGVDIISISLGPPQPYSQALFTDGTSIGSFHAVANNIVVVSSAGNDGPAPSSVTNVAPWAFTVAASTMDREFLSKISLGNNKSILGASLNRGLSPSSPSNNKLYPMINSVDARLPHVSIDDANMFAYLDDAKTYIGVQPAPILIAGHTGNSSHSDNTTTSPRAKHKRGTDRGNSSHSDNTTTSPRAKHKRGTDTGMHE
ncbi:hypothetical protein Fmac_030890 [Flemingia macrophylla]|uniref:Peptidase S8/S53 domain-containing protein n=1 Tax=Flemingia macrophylla TaxID=520843 RepID=A0ABD1L0G9_9FABA